MVITRIPLKCKAGEWYWIMAAGDAHLTSINSDVRQFSADLAEAVDRNARIILDGDLYDLILPKDSRRYNPSVLIPEMRGRDDIINHAVAYGANILKPAAENIDVMAMGNHEYAILKYHSCDVTSLTIEVLNQHLKESGSDHRIAHGGYSGYVQYPCRVGAASGATRTLDLLYHHGGGGESPVTRGMLDIARKRVNWVYDVFMFGHKHNLFATKDVTIRISPKGNLINRRSLSLQTGTYMKSYPLQSPEDAGIIPYSEQLNMAPKPIGCTWCKFMWTGEGSRRLELRGEI